MDSEYADIDRADEAYCRDLVKRVPALRPLLEEHLVDQGGELLGYIFLSDVARWAEANVVAEKAAVVVLINELNRGLAEGPLEVPNLIAVGFGESLSRETSLLPILQGDLRAWYEFDVGDSDHQPHLRSGE
ncbi:hypothetical protein ACFSWE_03525 [Leucobacter albus]|uniref:DUF7674 domain-containing protein n=1 Tax=Leucobacter albus TaxID=272210 RepID=A0ABW3TQ61_9MICO